jgi:3'-phosphoadenosine 5'-phosphosulfate (PAPS) 3'-phosphatase
MPPRSMLVVEMRRFSDNCPVYLSILHEKHHELRSAQQYMGENNCKRVGDIGAKYILTLHARMNVYICPAVGH